MIRIATVLLLAALAAGSVSGPAGAQDGERPRRLVIALDLSKSNPLVENKLYAQRAGEYVYPLIASLPVESDLMIRSFGAYGAGEASQLAFRATISMRSNPAEQWALDAFALIASVPDQVAAGTMQAQPQTNILAFLDNLAQLIDCRMPTTIVLISDGIEDSEFARLKQGGGLPNPKGAPFKNCRELQIIGLGQGANSPELTARLRKEWSEWADKAGFRTFTGLNEW